MSGKLTRRDVIKQGAAVLAAYALNPPSRVEAATSFDLDHIALFLMVGVGFERFSDATLVAVQHWNKNLL